MRTIDPLLQEKLTSGTTTMCRCWLVERRDGRAIGFTDHDLDVSFDGHVFQAGTGLDAAALESTSGLSVDNSQAVGALSAVGLTDEDISAGRYDGASVWLWTVDWTDPALRVLLFRGYLGEIERGDSAFEVELRGLSEALNRTVGRSYLTTCDRILGDHACKFDITAPGYTVVAQVAEVSGGRTVSVEGISGFAQGWFEHGELCWLSGRNTGVISKIKFDQSKGITGIVETWDQAPHAVEVGDQFKLTAGCNKSAETCRVKFNNFLNFRGFPQMPGEDWVASYPSESGDHDGGRITNG